MVRHVALAAMALALASCASGPASGPGRLAHPAQPGYVTSAGGVVTSGFDLCWHTRGWSPDKAIAPCDPVPVVMTEIQPPAPVPAPEPMAPVKEAAAPAPAPAPEPPPPAPVIDRVALDTELLFDFDSAVLRPSGRAKLEEVVLKLHGADIRSIEAIGHADRIASDAYNQALSEERAAAVKAYLASLGFDARDIRAAGHGESEPVTGERCAGLGPENGANLKLVRCLQPDRRVELEVRGTKKGAI